MQQHTRGGPTFSSISETPVSRTCEPVPSPGFRPVQTTAKGAIVIVRRAMVLQGWVLGTYLYEYIFGNIEKCLGADIYCSIYAMIHFTHRWCTQRKPFSECLKFPQIQGCGALISFGATLSGASQAPRWDCPPALSPGLANR